EWHRVRLQASPQHPGLEGKDFVEIAALMALDPWDAYFRILADAGPAIESLLLIGELFTDDHLAEMISHPLFCLGVDGYTASLDDAALEAVAGHPVCFAGHVHYLTHHVRELDTLPLETAIHKMTAMPARHFGLDRGVLGPGAAAALVVFAPDRLADGSTVARPLAYAEGVDEVFVNGTAVIVAGEHTGARPGRPLARR